MNTNRMRAETQEFSFYTTGPRARSIGTIHIGPNFHKAPPKRISTQTSRVLSTLSALRDAVSFLNGGK